MKNRLLLILLSASRMLLAQDGLDSLQRALKTAAGDSARVDALNELSGRHRRLSNFDSAVYYAREAIRLTEGQVRYQKGRGKAYNMLGNACSMQGNWPESLKSYFISLKIMEEAGEKRAIASCYGNIGNIYYYQANYTDALRYHRAALKVKQQLGDKKGMVFTLNSLANIYTNQSNYADAKKNFEEALRILKESLLDDGSPADKTGLAVTLQGLGNIYFYENDFEAALQKYSETLQIQEELQNRLGIANSLINIGGTYNKLGAPEKSLAYAQRGKSIGLQIGSAEMVKEANEALSDAEEALAKRTGQAVHYRKALAYYKDYIANRDSLLNEENTKASVRLEMNYEFEKKEAAAKLEQEKKDAVAAAEKRRQRIVLLSISGFGLLVLGFAVFAWRSLQHKKRANAEIMRQKEMIEHKQKEILDSIHYARRIQTALLPHEKLVARHLARLQKKV
jgi:tetratricopeptide (TPR) repeat protein